MMRRGRIARVVDDIVGQLQRLGDEARTLNQNLAGICSHLKDIHDALIEDEGLVSELRVVTDRLGDIKEELRDGINVDVDDHGGDVAEELWRMRLERPAYNRYKDGAPHDRTP